MLRVAVLAIFVLPQLGHAQFGLRISVSGFDQDFVGSYVNSTLNKYARDMEEIDPYIKESYSKVYQSGSCSAKFYGQNIILTGFSDFVATYLDAKLSPASMETNIRFHQIELFIPKYDFDGKVGFADLRGNGRISLIFDTLNVFGTTNADVGFSGLRQIRNLKVKMRPTASYFEITGLLYNEPFSKLVSKAVTENIPAFMEKYQTVIGKVGSSMAEEMLNGVIAEMHSGESTPLAPVAKIILPIAELLK